MFPFSLSRPKESTRKLMEKVKASPEAMHNLKLVLDKGGAGLVTVDDLEERLESLSGAAGVPEEISGSMHFDRKGLCTGITFSNLPFTPLTIPSGLLCTLGIICTAHSCYWCVELCKFMISTLGIGLRPLLPALKRAGAPFNFHLSTPYNRPLPPARLLDMARDVEALDGECMHGPVLTLSCGRARFSVGLAGCLLCAFLCLL